MEFKTPLIFERTREPVNSVLGNIDNIISEVLKIILKIILLK